MAIRNDLAHQRTSRSLTEVVAERSSDLHAAICTDLEETFGMPCGPIAAALARLAAGDLFLRDIQMSLGDLAVARRFGESARGHLVAALQAAGMHAAARRVQ